MFGAISHTVETHGNSDMSAGYVLISPSLCGLWHVLLNKKHTYTECASYRRRGSLPGG